MDETAAEKRNLSAKQNFGKTKVDACQVNMGRVQDHPNVMNEQMDPALARTADANRRFAVKLRLLGASAGFFILLMLIGIGGLLMLKVIPAQERLLLWAVPMGSAAAVLIGVWYTRSRQYEHPSLIWYLSLLFAVLLTGIAWASFLTHTLELPVSSQQSAALMLLTAEVVMGTLFFAVDLLVVGVYLLGIGVTTFVYMLLYKLEVPSDYLTLLFGSVVSVPLLAVWEHRQQRNLVRGQAELQILRSLYENSAGEAQEIKMKIEEQASHQKEVERELYLAKDEAESASIAKSEFLATMSHEIRTPLNGIVPILEILRETRLDSEQVEFVTTALNSSHHLMNLINDILDYSKIEAGKLELESIELNIEELVDSVIALMTKSAERRGIKLKRKIAKNVPNRVRGDPFRLRQILTNLVGNAIKFTDKGMVSVEVSRHVSSPKEVVILFAVRDTGIGMSQDAVSHLFELFSQADTSTTRKYGGTGLGLVICKRLVEMMGGRIGVKSEESKGSVFWFVAPMRKGLNEAPSIRKSLQGVRVLLSGFDELEHQRIISYLSEWEMLYEHASTAVETLTKLKASARLGTSWSYDVLICDVQTMGSGVAGMMRDIHKVFELSSLEILAVDAFQSMASSIREHGIREILTRPIQQKELRSRLYRLLDVQAYADGHSRQEEDPSLGRTLGVPDQAYGWDDGRPETTTAWKASESRKRPPPSSATTTYETPLVGKVLVVEDNPVNLTVIKKLLQRFGLNCDAVGDGVEAVEVTNTNQYDLVLMDVQMPKMDGYQATQSIRLREAEKGMTRMPIVAMTANAMAGDREKCLVSGMDDYLPKPVKPVDLKSMLRQWLPMKAATMPEMDNAKTPAFIGNPSNEQAAELDSQETMTEVDVDNGVLDRVVLGELFDIMEGDAPALLQEYLNSAPDLLARVSSAVERNDPQSLVLPAHSLKSSSANVGAMRVSELAKDLEAMGRGHAMVNASVRWKEIKAAYIEAESSLKRIIEYGSL